MAKPVILSVDDDPEVLRSIERDLRKRYSDRFRVIRADSGAAAIDAIRQLKQRGDAVALMLVDQRMPNMSGVEFLVKALEFYPNSKRALLTAYADTEAAIKAINEVRIHHYLLKPWDPPEEQLYPVIDDLLEDWQASFTPPFEGVRVLGTRWAPKCYDIRAFLAKNQVPYQWIDLEAAEKDKDAKALADSLKQEELLLPLVLFPDGTKLGDPTHADLAAKIGLRTKAEANFYDLVIVGGGPAGLAAAVYGASEGLGTVIVEREAPGGQAGLSSRIENYLGFPSGLSGGDLARRAVTQAKRFGVEILTPQEAVQLRVDGPYRIVQLSDGSQISCHVLLIATGVQWRKLDIPGMDHLQGAGVYYGAGATEAVSCKDEDLYVVGGANSAGQAAMHFAKFARHVVMLVRGPSLAASMSQYLIDQIQQTPNITVETETEVVEVHGESRLEQITLLCRKGGERKQVPASSMFIFIGAEPGTEWLGGSVLRDERGFILSGADVMKDGKRPQGWTLDRDPGLLETSVPGIFVVGDVRKGSVKRVASGVGEGAIAVQFIHQYLSKV